MSSVETFGHEPTKGLSLFDVAETVCQRCTERGVWWSRGSHEMTPVRIPWPCTSAIVLGLVPRSCDHCKGQGNDPDDLGEWIPEAGMYKPTAPCPQCHGSGHAAVGER